MWQLKVLWLIWSPWHSDLCCIRRNAGWDINLSPSMLSAALYPKWAKEDCSIQCKTASWRKTVDSTLKLFTICLIFESRYNPNFYSTIGVFLYGLKNEHFNWIHVSLKLLDKKGGKCKGKSLSNYQVKKANRPR